MNQYFSGLRGFSPAQPIASQGEVERLRELLSPSQRTSIALQGATSTPIPTEERARNFVPSGVITVDAGEIDWIEATTRLLVWAGHGPQSRTIAHVAIALSGLENHIGRPRRSPHLYMRSNMIWMTDGETRESTGCRPAPDKDYMTHPGANAKLGELVEKRVRKILGRVLKKDVTVSQAFACWLMHHRPGSHPDALDKQRHDEVANHLGHLEEFIGQNSLAELGWNTGIQYMAWSTSRQIKSQSAQADPSEIRYIARSTARAHIKTLIMVLVWYCSGENNIEPIPIKVPRVRRPGIVHLTFREIVRLISACKGRIYDLKGRVIGHHKKRKRYECVIRYILLYLYGGTRHTNILLLTWFQDHFMGHIDLELGILERQGGAAEITNKRRGTSFLIGSLVELVARWRAEDDEMRKKFPGRYVHIIHDEFGLPIATLDAKNPSAIGKRMHKLFDEVRKFAGLPKARPHMLKHSGVTFAVRAYMPIPEIEVAFSTSAVTLWTCYAHLVPFLKATGHYDPAKLKFAALRKLSSRPLSAHA